MRAETANRIISWWFAHPGLSVSQGGPVIIDPGYGSARNGYTMNFLANYGSGDIVVGYKPDPRPPIGNPPRPYPPIPITRPGNTAQLKITGQYSTATTIFGSSGGFTALPGFPGFPGAPGSVGSAISGYIKVVNYTDSGEVVVTTSANR